MKLSRVIEKHVIAKTEPHISLEDELEKQLVNRNYLDPEEAKEFAKEFANHLGPMLRDESHRIDLAGHTYIDRHKLQWAIAFAVTYLEHWLSDTIL
jgi:hypothetical protein